jgi:hypothetical protein
MKLLELEIIEMSVLSKSSRERLCQFAKDSIKVPDETKALDMTYNKAAVLIRAEIDKKFPPSDMAILDKYKVAKADYCINNRYGFMDDVKFTFRNDDVRAPLLPNRGCSDRSFEWTEKTKAAIAAYNAAAEVHKKAFDEKLHNYRALIFSSRNFNEVVKAWPAAEQLRPFCSPTNSLPAIPEKIIFFVQNDNAGAVL